jgi:hypothetical protein
VLSLLEAAVALDPGNNDARAAIVQLAAARGNEELPVSASSFLPRGYRVHEPGAHHFKAASVLWERAAAIHGERHESFTTPNSKQLVAAGFDSYRAACRHFDTAPPRQHKRRAAPRSLCDCYLSLAIEYETLEHGKQYQRAFEVALLSRTV